MTANTLIPKLSFALEAFLLDGRARRLRPTTITFYRQQCGYFLTYAQQCGIGNPQEITAHTIRSYFVSLQERGLAEVSVQSAARAIRALCNFMVRDEIITHSPFAKVKMPKADDPTPTSFTSTELKQLYKTADSHRDRAILLCLLDTGCRAAEFIAWNVGDVNINTGAVHLRHTKNRESRTVYIGLRARRDLLKHYAGLPDVSPDAPIWINENNAPGQRLTDSGLRQLLERIADNAGVDHCSPHKFRRTYALTALRSGMNVYALQRLMGHKTLDMLLRYLRLTEGDLKDVAGKYGAVDSLFD